MKSFIIILSLVSLTYSKDINTMPETKSMLNWGVVLSRSVNVMNGLTKYRHTFEVKIPQLDFTPIEAMTCDTDELKALHCEAINSLIAKINAQTTPVINDLQNKLNLWLNPITNIDLISVDGGSGRKKRSIRKKRSKNLGPDYCEKIESGGSSGGGGGFLGSLGNAMSSLFGQPSWDDIKVIDKHICQLADVVEMNTEQIVALGNDFATFSKVANDRMDAIESGIINVNDRVTETQTQLVELAEQAFADLNELDRRLKKSMLGTNLLFAVQESLYSFQNQIEAMITQVNIFGDGINILLSGRLPPQMVPVERLREIIDIISDKTTPTGRIDLVSTDPNFYYMLNNIAFTRSEITKSVYIMLNFPLYSVGGLMATYRIDTTYISTSEDQTTSTKIVNLPDFIAVTPDETYFTEYSTAELYSCSGTTVKSCFNERALQDINKPSCAAALYMDNQAKILQLCDIRYDDTPVPSGAVKMSSDTYLVHSSNAGKNIFWTMSCPLVPNFTPQKIEACNTCMLRVQCGCEVNAPGEFIIPMQLDGCAGNLATIIPDIKPEYPVSLPVLHAYFDTDVIKNIRGDTVRASKWGIDIPKLTTLEVKWNNSIEMSRRYSGSLNKLIDATKKNRLDYAEKAGALLKEATDFTDLKLTPIKTLSDTFSDLSWLTDWDVLGGGFALAGGLVLPILTLVMTCYVFCKRRV